MQPSNVENMPGDFSTDETVHYQNTTYLDSDTSDRIYTYTFPNSKGDPIHYASGDLTKELAAYKPLGFALTSLIFSIFLLLSAASIYKRHCDENHDLGKDVMMLVFGGILLVLWVFVIFARKELPPEALIYEILLFPNQFVFICELTSLLFFCVGSYRFAMVAFMPSASGDSKAIKDSRFSVVGFIVTLIAVVANLLKIFEIIKLH